MTKPGEKLVGVGEEQLREQLRTERDSKAIKRLVAALEYKYGLSPAKIQRKYGWHEQTVYDWLDIVAEREDVALSDRPRGGSFSRLTDDQWKQLTATLQASPSEVGVDAPAWKPPLVRDYIADIFGIAVLARAHVSCDEEGRAVGPDSPAGPL